LTNQYWFTIEEAMKHWGSDEYPNKERGERYVQAITMALSWL